MNHDLNPEHVHRIIGEYDIGGYLNIKELSPGYANRSFKLETETGPYLFRWVLEKDRKDLQLELDLLEHLRGFDFKTSYPVAKGDGSFMTELAPGYAVIYDFIRGEHPELSSEAASQIGTCVGKLNSITPPENFLRLNTINIEACLELSEGLPGAPVKLPDIYEYFSTVSKLFADRLPVDLPQGVIHADVFPDNTLFHQNELQAVIDFEEACWDVLLFDLAMAINGFCFPHNELSYPFLESILNGYQLKRKLTSAEWDALPIYIQWTAHGMLSWHLSRLANVMQNRQEKRVRELMRRVKYLRESESHLKEYLFKLGS